MKKTIHHVWNPIEDDKHDHKKCERCNCEKWFDYAFRTTVYSLKGLLYRRRPQCVYPNTKL